MSAPTTTPKKKSIPLVKTATPGIFKRGGRYVVIYRDGAGRQHKQAARTLEEARRVKSKWTLAPKKPQGDDRQTFEEYATEWIDRHFGHNGEFRETTRKEYKRLLETHAYPFLGRTRLSEISTYHIAKFLGHLKEQKTPSGELWSTATIANVVKPVRSCLAAAKTEGLIESNPAAGMKLPRRQVVLDTTDEEEDKARTFTREQLRLFLQIVNPKYRLLFETLAATGMRISEAIALRWNEVQLNGSDPHVKVRRTLVRGHLHPPKSKYGRRDIAIDSALVDHLRAWRNESKFKGDEDLVFANRDGNPLHIENVRRRVLSPAAEEVGAGFAGFHTFRHTAASILFARGANAVQVQRFLGHHSAAFTLTTYVHLFPQDISEPISLSVELVEPSEGGNRRQQKPQETAGIVEAVEVAEYAISRD